MSTLRPLHDPAHAIMRVAGFMSGSGSNIRKLLERQRELGDLVYKVVVLFSDRYDSNAPTIGKEFDIPVVIRDIRGFYKKRGKKLSDLSIRHQYDTGTYKTLEPYNVSVAAFGGYMSIASKILCDAYLGINVHPADLSLEVNGKRKYTGNHAVADAMRAGETHIRSTTHIVTPQVDAGQILMRSKPLEVIMSESPDENQNRLKVAGDWVIFPKTIEYVALGRYACDESGTIHFDGTPIPRGVQLIE